MNGSSTSRASGSDTGAGTGGVVSRVREAIELLRDPAAQAAGPRPDRTDVRAAVLLVLDEEPMSGYGVVRAVAERSDGAWTPGAGAVYPMLQLLADEGLVTAAEAEGRRTWSLSDAGRAAARAAEDPFAAPEAPGAPPKAGRGALSRSTAQLVQTAVLVPQTGSKEQIADAVAVVDEARRRLIAILARN